MALKCTGRKKKSPINANGGPGDPPEVNNPTDSIYVKPDEASQAYGVIEEGMYPIDMKGIQTNKEGMVLEVGPHDRSLGLNKKGVIAKGGGGYEINANQDLPRPVKFYNKDKK